METIKFCTNFFLFVWLVCLVGLVLFSIQSRYPRKLSLIYIACSIMLYFPSSKCQIKIMEKKKKKYRDGCKCRMEKQSY